MKGGHVVRGLIAVHLGAALLVAGLAPVAGASAARAPSRAAPAAVRAAAGAPLRVLITGDSITQGSAGDYTWRYRLWQKLQRTGPTITFVGPRRDLYDVVHGRTGSHDYAVGFAGDAHAALWGDTYAHELGRVADQVDRARPDVLVVMLGSNDLVHQTSPQETISHVETYVARARAARPGLDVVLGEATDRYDLWKHQSLITARAQDFARRLDLLAARLDTSAERVVVARTLTGWDAARDTWDGTHPNPSGEAVIAQRVSEALARLGIGSAAPDISAPRSWTVPGPPPAVRPGSDGVALGWDRTRAGATGMYVEERLVQTREPWHRLPYAMAGNGGKVSLLVPGGTYQFRLVPVKGSSVGAPGPVRQVRIGGPRLGEIRTFAVTPGGDSLYGGKRAATSWSPARNANAYLVSSRLRTPARDGWVQLPYPVLGRSWTFEANATGMRYQYAARPARGYLRGPWRRSAAIRMHGSTLGRGWQVSLGDSYSAGVGSSQPFEDLACFRTGGAWPRLLPNFMIWLHACSGAQVDDLGNQIQQMNADFGRTRLPQLITVTIGGNDAGFSRGLAECVLHACRPDGARLGHQIDALEPKLVALYRRIRAAQPFADIVVGGYPGVVQVGGDSTNLACVAVDDDERLMIDALAARLNSRIANAARRAGVWTVGQSVRRRFAGHNACAGRASWIRSPALGYGGGGIPVDVRSFHPTDAGQRAYAQVFSSVVRARSR